MDNGMAVRSSCGSSASTCSDDHHPSQPATHDQVRRLSGTHCLAVFCVCAGISASASQYDYYDEALGYRVRIEEALGYPQMPTMPEIFSPKMPDFFLLDMPELFLPKMPDNFMPDIFLTESETLPGLLVRALARVLPAWVSVSLVIAVATVVALWGIWESTKFPRHLSMRSPWDILRIMVQLIGDILLMPYFLVARGETPVVSCQQTDQNLTILSMCPSLHQFKQTAWLRNPYLAFAALMCHDMTGANPNLVERELVTAEDGGVVALDWWVGERKEASMVDKVLFVGSTFTGDALTSAVRDICGHFSSHGWQCVVMVKRGCGLTMPNVQPVLEANTSRPAPWCLGGFDDVNLAVNHVASKFPNSKICGLGLSCGSVQLRNYVNRTGASSKLFACVCVDAAENWQESFLSLDQRQPLLSMVLAAAAKRSLGFCQVDAPPKQEKFDDTIADDSVFFGSCTPFSAPKQESKAATGQAGMMDFVRGSMAPAHGFGSSPAEASEYLRGCQPADSSGCDIPVLELFTYNDTLIDVPTVDKLMRLQEASPNVVTCSTRWGTHIVRWQGISSQCWITAVSWEFLESSLFVLNSRT